TGRAAAALTAVSTPSSATGRTPWWSPRTDRRSSATGVGRKERRSGTGTVGRRCHSSARSTTSADRLRPRAGRLTAEVPGEPAGGQRRHLVQCAGLLEEVRRSGHDLEALLGADPCQRLPV